MQRLDVYLVQTDDFSGREKAKIAILAGHVSVNGMVIKKPSFLVNESDQVDVKKQEIDYVGRGGYKLAAALDAFSISVAGCTVVDLGASTGGFTDCLLKNGAKKVYAVDVGTNQLVSSLRSNAAVVVMEQTNARNLSADSFPDRIDFVTADLSFISLTLIFPAVASILSTNGHAICLVKPQFEAGKENVGKNGIVRDPKVHTHVLKKLFAEAQELGLQVVNLTPSPITGGDGNIEFLMALKKSDAFPRDLNVEEIVRFAHQTLGGKRK